MDFTREPIIETIITPKEGYKLVVRSSKSAGQEEYFVDAVEIAAFGHALFFRSLERPKAFLVPVLDYEVLEVREARMVLKNAVLDRSIKIGGGRDTASKAVREPEKEAPTVVEESEGEKGVHESILTVPEAGSEGRIDKRRDRRRHYRKRKGREEGSKSEALDSAPTAAQDEEILSSTTEVAGGTEEFHPPLAPPLLSSLLQPPPVLISETIHRYRQDELFRGAFYQLKEEEQYKPHDQVQELLNEEEDNGLTPSLRAPVFESEETVDPSSPLLDGTPEYPPAISTDSVVDSRSETETEELPPTAS